MMTHIKDGSCCVWSQDQQQQNAGLGQPVMLISLWLKIFSLKLSPLAGWWTESQRALKHERLFASLSLPVIKLQRQRRRRCSSSSSSTHTVVTHFCLHASLSLYVHQATPSIHQQQLANPSGSNPLAHGGSRPPLAAEKRSQQPPATPLSFAAAQCGPLFSALIFSMSSEQFSSW